jgi:dihydroorotate dehydrogenase electron transfer subunit
MADPRRVRATLARTTRLAPHTHRLQLAGCRALVDAAPGQFVMLRGEDWGTDPLLGRAFSILGVSDDGVLDLLVKVVGKASARLAQAAIGDGFQVLGPLGTGFPPPDGGRRDWLVAGGVGLAPLLMHAGRAAAAGAAARVALFYGGRTAADLVLIEEAERLGVSVVLVTEDGSRGERGLVTAAVERALAADGGPPPTLLACGPEPMLVATARLAHRRALPAYLSLEGEMACGIGACLACAVASAEPPAPPAGGAAAAVAGPRFRYTCVDGPVFALDALAGPYARGCDGEGRP